MFSSNILNLLLGATLAAAAALPVSAVVPRELGENDMILFGANGRMEIMDKEVYANLTQWGNVPIHPGPIANLTSTTPLDARDALANIEARCSKQTIYTVDSTHDFLDWDVQMSSVVLANGDTTSIAVTDGYSVGNSVSVTAGFDANLVKDFLGASFSVSYSQSWTTTATTGYTYQIPKGKYSAIVSNPRTTRRVGHVDVGCIAQPIQSYHFQADSRYSKSFGGFSWVEGTIQLCSGNSYPLKRCHGQGFIN